MARGSKTSAHKLAQFRAHYLYSGNAAEAARAVKLAESTGRDLAVKLSTTKSFVEARRKLRDQYLDELVAGRMRVVRTALERFESDLEMPEPVEGGPPVTIIDKRADYGQLVLVAEKNAHALARFDAEVKGEVQPIGSVIIKVSGPADAKLGDDGA
jgi:hypothetical protein